MSCILPTVHLLLPCPTYNKPPGPVTSRWPKPRTKMTSSQVPEVLKAESGWQGVCREPLEALHWCLRPPSLLEHDISLAFKKQTFAIPANPKGNKEHASLLKKYVCFLLDAAPRTPPSSLRQATSDSAAACASPSSAPAGGSEAPARGTGRGRSSGGDRDGSTKLTVTIAAGLGPAPQTADQEYVSRVCAYMGFDIGFSSRDSGG